MSLLKVPLDDKPGVHALIIGVGAYPYLDGGRHAGQFDNTQGMGQLASPPRSAAAMAQWLTGEHAMANGQALQSLAVLCSGRSGLKDVHGKAVANASSQNVKQAIRDWYERGNSHPDNLMFFYFCGHGVTTGAENSLLLDDFGADAYDPFSAAVDAGKWLTGMRRCKAIRQVYLIDACRTVQEDYLERYANSGAAILDATAHSNLGDVQQAVIWSTALGQQAFGDPKKSSLFASSMFEALKGAACTRDSNGAWVVKPLSLKEGLDTIMSRRAPDLEQIVSVDQVTRNFPFHYLSGPPKVPAMVRCQPSEAMRQSALMCSSSAGFQASRQPKPDEQWELDLDVGHYEFKVTLPLATKPLGQLQGVLVFPPETTVLIPCQGA